MSDDVGFKEALTQLFLKHKITCIIESGTFRGLGSTSTLAQVIEQVGIFKPEFYTIEVDKQIHQEALENLKHYDFIKPLCGLSVSYSDAVRFIKTDEAIIHHQKYPNVYIDDVFTPQKFYMKEIKGKISNMLGEKISIWNRFKRKIGIDNMGDYKGTQNLLIDLLDKYKNEKPLVLLDSAGGIGYLEFLKVMETMQNKPFYLILDDIHHLKHFRSYESIKKDENFTIMALNEDNGWLICSYKMS